MDLENTRIFITQAHSGQKRKSSNQDFVLHPLRVEEHIRFFNNPVLNKAALLHDVLEDTSVTEEELRKYFDEEVVDLVKELTKDKSLPKELAEKAYREKLVNASDEAKILKLMDIYDNVNESFKGPGWPLFLKKCKNTLVVLKVDNPLYKSFFDSKKEVLLKKINKELK